MIAGYDSNLFAVNGGPGDGFATLRPMLELSRKDAEYSLVTEAWFDWTSFAKEVGDDSFDPGVRITLLYPANVDLLPTQSAEVHWIRTTAANLDVGQRITHEDALAKYEGDLVNTGKSAVAGRVSLDRDEYVGVGFDTIDTAVLGATFSYLPDDLYRAGVGYDLTLGQSQPNASGMTNLDQTEQAFTLQWSGEFTPKITGKISVGAAYSRYTGSFYHYEWDAIAEVDLVWRPRERLSISAEAARGPTFNPDGDVDLDSSVRLEVLQELQGGLAISSYLMGGRTDHERTTIFRTDNFWGTGAGMKYDLGGKVKAFVDYEWTRQESDVLRYAYRRQVVSAKVTYSF
jgi:opacity protein-like surface antigen